MGDRITWYEDCPKCGGKDTLERYEALSSCLKVDTCSECGFVQNYEIYDSEDVITINKVE